MMGDQDLQKVVHCKKLRNCIMKHNKRERPVQEEVLKIRFH